MNQTLTAVKMNKNMSLLPINCSRTLYIVIAGTLFNYMTASASHCEIKTGELESWESIQQMTSK